VAPLLELIEGRLGAEDTVFEITLQPEDGQGQAWLHDRGEVLSRKAFPDGRILMKVRLAGEKAGQALARFGKAMKPLGARKAAAE
jgi:GTP-binding protein HflX